MPIRKIPLLHRRSKMGSAEEALKALHERVEVAKQYPIKEAERRVGVSGYSKDGDTAGYLSPHEYDEVEELPVEYALPTKRSPAASIV